QGQAVLGRLGRVALLPVDLAQLLPRVDVVGEACHHRLELVRGLVDQPVLAEDLPLRQVLVDELAVLVAQRPRDLDPGTSGRGGGTGGRSGGASGGGRGSRRDGARRGRGRRRGSL